MSQVSESYLGMFRHPQLIRKHFGPSNFRFHFLEHHQCHAASTFFVSGFERAAIMTWDGTGEDTTTLQVAVGTALGRYRRYADAPDPVRR